MPRLVDGDNLLGSWPGRKRSDAERRALSFQVERLARRIGRRIVLVFDGTCPPGAAPGGETLFSERGRSADEVILGRLRNERDPHGWWVVTNDRSLADQARYLGARVERCETFRRILLQKPDREKPNPDEDLAYWKQVFGADE